MYDVIKVALMVFMVNSVRKPAYHVNMQDSVTPSMEPVFVLLVGMVPNAKTVSRYYI